MRFWCRCLDVVIAGFGLVLLFPLLVLLFVVGYFDTGSPIFRQVRVGLNQDPFVLIKFRTMRMGTAAVATHEVDANAVTGFGRLLRKTKLDELPQLWNVLKGEMSLVGPRPCLPVQDELIRERAARGVFGARPGITGLAQLKGIDMSEPALLARTDEQMLRTLTLPRYVMIIVLTALGKGIGDRVVERK
ncbi:sugar transferase [Marinobacter piscensis]|uniref:sugar transferase n=1 Tax=Marinobacter piscensis TaxID=1562308 RepID=UPI0011A46E5D|nr:sugar transferase [Marinobacter piscensis]